MEGLACSSFSRLWALLLLISLIVALVVVLKEDLAELLLLLFALLIVHLDPAHIAARHIVLIFEPWVLHVESFEPPRCGILDLVERLDSFDGS